MQYVPWMLLLAALVLFPYACRVLIADVKGGYEVSMGGAGFFSGTWLFACVTAATGLTMLSSLAWWWGIFLFVALFLVKSLVFRVICGLYLGAEAPPLPKNGFKEFIRKVEEKR